MRMRLRWATTAHPDRFGRVLPDLPLASSLGQIRRQLPAGATSGTDANDVDRKAVVRPLDPAASRVYPVDRKSIQRLASPLTAR